MRYKEVDLDDRGAFSGVSRHMKKAIAEFIGTFALVFIGCGTIVVGGMATGSTAITELAIALAFGLSIVAMAYGIGQISGCHVNPAVSFGVYYRRKNDT